MGDKAGIFPTDEGMDIPGLRDGDMVGTTLAAPPVAGLLGEICHWPTGGGVPQEELELVRLRCPKVAAAVGGVPPSVKVTFGGES